MLCPFPAKYAFSHGVWSIAFSYSGRGAAMSGPKRKPILPYGLDWTRLSVSGDSAMEMRHPYLPMTKEIEEEMLKSMGRATLEELFSNIPANFRLRRDLNLPSSHSELEVIQRMHALAEKNTPANTGRVFLGGGVGLHYVPAAVSSVASRSEFVTAYTSYQPEVSQGMLQTLFEYQSLLAELLDVDVVNSSLYDMGTSLGEAARMVARVNKKSTRFLVPSTVNPSHYRVMLTYTEPAGITIEKVGHDAKTGLMSMPDLKKKLDEGAAGVYIENPSYLGFLEHQVDEISKAVHDAESLLVAGVDVLSMGLLRPPGNYGADIVIGEGQVLGNPASYGGPLLGVFGCKNDRKLVYQLPGRLVGMTTTLEEPYEQGFVLTLSPREQHIRREKATSNICSNQALMAVNAAIYMSVLGPAGLSQLSETIAYRSNYAAKRLGQIPGVEAPGIGTSHWKDFVVRFRSGISSSAVHEALLKRGYHGGKILNDEFPELGESMLFSVTEMHSKESIDGMVEAVKQIVTKGGGK